MYQQRQGESKPKKLFKYYRKEQINEVLERARSDNQRNYLMLFTLWRTGMRCEELTSLKKKDITDVITIRQGKGNKDRIIPLDETLGDLLKFYTSNMTLEDTIFPLTNAQVRNICHQYQGDIDVHPHTFRHSFSVHYLKSGGNIRVLQKILGHSNLNTTAVYLDLIGDDIKEDYKKIQW
jgi:integrase/recombinase XerD